jgi:hypothetical protein
MMMFFDFLTINNDYIFDNDYFFYFFWTTMIIFDNGYFFGQRYNGAFFFARPRHATTTDGEVVVAQSFRHAGTAVLAERRVVAPEGTVFRRCGVFLDRQFEGNGTTLTAALRGILHTVVGT